MINLSAGEARVVSGSACTAVSDHDTVYASTLRMAADFIDATKGRGVPVALSQRAYREFNKSFATIVESRGALQSVISTMQVIQRHSTIHSEDVGCPDWLVKILVKGEDAAPALPAEDKIEA